MPRLSEVACPFKILISSLFIFLTLLSNIVPVFSQSAPVLDSANFFGGSGDQRGTDVAIAGDKLYMSGQDATVFNAQSLAVSYSLSVLSSPAWTALWPNLSGSPPFHENFFGVTATSQGPYFAGQSYSQTSDGVGGKEAKGVLVKYPPNGPTGLATGGAEWIAKPNFFSYTGGEELKDAIVVEEEGDTFIYVAGGGQPCSHFAYVISKYDSSGNLLLKATDSDVGINFNQCFFPFGFGSNAIDVTVLNGNIYSVGVAAISNVAHPSIRKHDKNLSLVWKEVDTNLIGDLFGATVFEGSIYAVGATRASAPDQIIQKYNEAGDLLWSTTEGGAGTDVLTNIAGVGNRLFAVGYTNSSGAGGFDVVILEINPGDGTILSTTLFGGTQDDKANGIATDGFDLYVGGESRSFGSSAGNQVGQNDLMLLKYTLESAPPTDDIPPVITAPNDLSVDSTGLATFVDIGTPVVSDNVSEVADITVTNDAPDSFFVGTTIVTWTATDEAGNSSTATQSVTVLSPDEIIDGLADDIANLNLPKGTRNSLASKLDSADKVLNDLNPKNDKAGDNSLKALINSIEAQSGKKISVEDANELIARIQNLIQLL